MLKRIYIDNYKIFVNFSLDFKQSNLLLGENGSGKTTLFEVINKLKEFVIDNKRVEEIFKIHTLTRWQTVPLQRFELMFEDGEALYTYKCCIEYDSNRQICRLHDESLEHNQQPLFKFYIDEKNTSHAKLYNDQYQEGPELPFGWSQSGVGYVQARPDNNKLTRFKQLLAQCLVIQMIPSKMSVFSEKEEEYPDCNVSNYVNWYRYLSQDTEQVLKLVTALREVLPNFDNFKLETEGGAKTLWLRFKTKSVNYSCRFDELSDGQRSLCVLYTLVYGLSKPYTLCIDEPENFLALREINPWLNTCYDEWHGQLILISHHPTIMNNFVAHQARACRQLSQMTEAARYIAPKKFREVLS
jgi:predicted ATPase